MTWIRAVDMATESSVELTPGARKTQGAILRGVASKTQTRIADALEIEPSTLGRWLDKELARFCMVLELAGLKVVAEGTHDYSPDDITALAHLAQRGLAGMAEAKKG